MGPDAVAVAGISYEQAPVELREGLHLKTEQATSLSQQLASRGYEAVALATCNRTEVYVAGSSAESASENARHALAAVGVSCDLIHRAYLHRNLDAASHLFRVAAGLESIVLGDTHVAAQVKQAHRAARSVDACRTVLDRLFAAAARTSKRVRTETAVSAGATTIPGVAVATADHLAGPLAGRRLLIVGSGVVATAVARSAASHGCRDVVVAGRSFERASKVAARVGGHAVRLDEIENELANADVVFSATASRGFVLTASHARNLLRERKALIVFDLAIPRDVDPAFRGQPSILMFDLDNLAQAVRETESTRRDERALAEVIITEEAHRWEAWRRARVAAPAIVGLRDEADRAREQVLKRHARDLERLAPTERRLVETITSQLVGRLTHTATIEFQRHTVGAEG
jgi:glutamyl-tRNA reductase